MKKFAIAIAVLGAMVLGQKALAGITATIDVYAQIDSTISVAVSPGNTWYDFGLRTTSEVVQASSAINVTNDGGGLDETFGLMVADASPGTWTAMPAPWGAPGAEEFKLRAQWDSDGDVVANPYSDADHGIDTGNLDSTGTKFAGDQTGINVPQSGVRNLWFELTTPLSTVDPNIQRIVVTVTASAS